MKRSLVAGVFLLAVASTPAQQAARVAEGSTNQWPVLHRCTVQVDGAAGATAPERIDLQLGGSLAAGTGPIVGARAVAAAGASRSASVDHAINTKGTGMAGRAAGGGTRVSCSTAPQAEGSRAAPAAGGAMPTAPTGPAWTCRVSGAESAPVFEVAAAAGVVHRDLAARAAGPGWAANGERLAIVRRGAALDGTARTACVSDGARVVSYDLAVGKKG